MLGFLDGVSYPALIVFAVLLLLLPFSPRPHVVDKLVKLRNRQRLGMLDVLDLLVHLTPAILLILKLIRDIF